MKVKKKLIAGIMATMFLVTMITFGIPARVSAYGGTVKIGIVGPKGWVQWDGLWEGAKLAAKIINDNGGMGGPGYPGGGYEVKLVDINEHSVPVPDPASAKAELLSKLDANTDLETIIGGFRSECVFPIRDEMQKYFAANDRPIYYIAGAATDELLDCKTGTCGACLRCDYDTWKFVFRTTPMNSTILFKMFGIGVLRQLILPRLAAIYGNPVKVDIIAENLIWCDGMVAALAGGAYPLPPPPPHPYSILGPNATIAGTPQRPSAIETDFSDEFATTAARGANVVIHIFSAVAGASFIGYYGAVKPDFVPVGINVESQMQEFYAAVGGACEHESFLASVGTRTNINPNAKPLSTAAFWDTYSAEYGHSPIYTAWGCYDGIIAMNETFSSWIGLTPTQRITAVIEPTVRTGLLGFFKYTQYHDVYSAPDCLMPTWGPPVAPVKTVRAHIPQWQAGMLNPVFPRDQPFSRKYLIPSWMYSHAETDFAGITIYPWTPDPFFPPIYQTVPSYAPNGLVGLDDLGTVGTFWFQAPPWYLLETDMTPQDLKVDVYDIAKVAMDYGYDATVEYGSWPIP